MPEIIWDRFGRKPNQGPNQPGIQEDPVPLPQPAPTQQTPSPTPSPGGNQQTGGPGSGLPPFGNLPIHVTPGRRVKGALSSLGIKQGQVEKILADLYSSDKNGFLSAMGDKFSGMLAGTKGKPGNVNIAKLRTGMIKNLVSSGLLSGKNLALFQSILDATQGGEEGGGGGGHGSGGGGGGHGGGGSGGGGGGQNQGGGDPQGWDPAGFWKDPSDPSNLPPGYGMGDFIDPFNAILSTIPVLEDIRDKELAGNMAQAGYGGNRWSTYGMGKALEAGTNFTERMQQLMTGELKDTAERALDRSLAAAGQGTQLGAILDQMPLNRMGALSGFGTYEQGRNDDIARLLFNDFRQNQYGLLPYMIGAAGGQSIQPITTQQSGSQGLAGLLAALLG